MQKGIRRLGIGSVAGLLGVMLVASTALSAVTFDPDSGKGFVGKGDVQLALDLNNAQLQSQAGSIQFRALSSTVTEVSWVCTNTKNENIQERERTTTTSVAGLVTKVDRVKNQITGFKLDGYNGTPVQSSTTDGPPLNSCPTNWELTPAGDPELVSSTSTLEVSNGGAWVALS